MEGATGKNIKALRKKIGFTQDVLGEFLGVQREVISYYESGGRKIPMDHLNKLADLFGVDTYDLITDDEITTKTNEAFAFRIKDFTRDDIRSIAGFRKIIKNYMRIIRLETEHSVKD